MLGNLVKEKKKSLFVYVVFILLLAVLVAGIVNVFSGQTEVFSQVVGSVSGNQELKTAENGRINILIIGTDKRLSKNNVESGHLTDTIMLVSVSPKDKTYTILSFPRDIWINKDFGGEGIAYAGKINAIYASSGVESLIKVIENLTKQKIQYHVTLSFSGFVEAIDAIGGIEVYVENTFDDFAYPIEGKENDLCGLSKEEVDKIFAEIEKQSLCTENNSCILFDRKELLEEEYENTLDDLKKQFDDLDEDKKFQTFDEYLEDKIERGDDSFIYNEQEYMLKVGEIDFPCRYETVHFSKGLQKMDGVTALKYARSRHAFGIEGSDFARAKRQQLVIDATKNKALSFSTFSNPVKLKNLYDSYKESVETDINFFEAQVFYSMLSDLENNGSYVISIGDDDESGSLLESLYGGPEYNNAFVLIPKNKNKNIISDFVTKVFEKKIKVE